MDRTHLDQVIVDVESQIKDLSNKIGDKAQEEMRHMELVKGCQWWQEVMTIELEEMCSLLKRLQTRKAESRLQ